MEILQSKVVPIRQADNNMPMDKKKLIRSSSQLLETHLQQRLPRNFSKVEDIVCHSEEVNYSTEVVDDIKVIKGLAKRLSAKFIDSVLKKISMFSREMGCEDEPSVFLVPPVATEEGLSLLPIDEIESQLLLEAYVSNCEKLVNKQLYALRSRLEFIVGVDNLKASENPFGPSVLLNIYSDLIRTEPFSKETLNLLFQCFCDVVLNDLADVLDKINELFVSEGVLPKIPIKKSSPAFSEGVVNQVESTQQQAPMQQGSMQQGSMPVSHAPSMAANNMQLGDELYNNLCSMAQVYRSSGDGSIGMENLAVAGEQLPTNDLISTLTNIQYSGADTEKSVRSQLGLKIQVDGQRQPYAEQDDTLIDVVAMFFDVILQDRHLPDVVRVMLAQLQIPILKVAMIDKEFFAKKSHPARQFLNALSEAGLGVSDKNKKIRSVVFEKMEALVERVLMEFEDDVNVFTELSDEFDTFMQQQQRQIDLIEGRSRTSTKSTEQLELTKRKASYEIALRLNGKRIPEFVQVFLSEAWSDVLVLALLRSEREPAEVQACIQIVERLLKSVSQPASVEGKNATLADLGRLLKDIKVGLDNISYDFHESAPFFKELESWHRQLLLSNEEQPEGLTSDVDDVSMVDFSEELTMESLEDSLLQELEAEQSTMPDDKFSKRANNMKVGDWIEYKDVDGVALRAKLSWKSSVTSSCLFVDDRGGKALEVDLVEFANELREKRISLLAQEKEPLVERVLAGMKKLVKDGSSEPNLA